MHPYSIDKKIRGTATIIIFICSYVLSQLLQSVLTNPLNTVQTWISNTPLSSISDFIFSLGIIPNILEAAVIFSLLTWFFETRAWKWKILMRIHGIPNLNGTWNGQLKSSYSDEPIEMSMEIKQTWSEISFHSNFPATHSESASNNAAICTESNRGLSIYFGFQNESSDINSGMQTYDGYNILSLPDENTISAKYFNNRPNPKKSIKGGNMGNFELKRKSNSSK
jgi:hypothetical protein